jgi:hypothetical protein
MKDEKTFESTSFNVGESQEMLQPGTYFKLINDKCFQISGENGETIRIESETPLKFSFKPASW